MIALALDDSGPEGGDGAAALLARARDLELPVLLDLLRAWYPGRAVRFASQRTAKARTNAVERVTVEGDTVLVTLNVGLFSASSPLPAYFQRLLDDPFATPALLALLDAVDDALLRAEVHSFYPEGAWREPAQLVRTRRDLLCAAQLASPATVAWVMEAAFPELAVDVERASLPCELRVEPARVGYAVLGRAALGDRTRGTVPGLRARLLGASRCWADQEWVVEAPRRVRDVVLPALAGRGVRLELTLDLRGVRRPLTLDGETALGLGTLDVEGDAPLVLFDGVIE